LKEEEEEEQYQTLFQFLVGVERSEAAGSDIPERINSHTMIMGL